jgi:MFS family permease
LISNPLVCPLPSGTSQALGPIIGGALTTGLGWRSIFWFLTIVAGLIWLSFLLFFRDTFRKERSLTYQAALKHHTRGKNSIAHEAASPGSTAPPSIANLHGDVEKGNPDPDAHAVPAAQIELTLRDVNPISPLLFVVRRINNLFLLIASGKMQWLSLTYS